MNEFIIGTLDLTLYKIDVWSANSSVPEPGHPDISKLTAFNVSRRASQIQDRRRNRLHPRR